MRILFVLGSKQAGGAENQALELIKWLQSTFDLHVILLGDDGPFVDLVKRESLYILNSSRGLLSDIRMVVKSLSRVKPDVVITWLYRADVLGTVFAHYYGVKTIIASARNTNWPNTSWWKRWVLKNVVNRFCNLVIANSETAKEFHAQLGYEESKIRVIPNFLRVEVCSLTTKKISIQKPLVLGIASRSVVGKGHLEVLSGLRFLIDKGEDVRVSFIGPGIPSWNLLINTVKRLNLETYVKLEPYNPNLEKWIHSIDAYVFASDAWESDSNMYTECIVHGVPVLATIRNPSNTHTRPLIQFDSGQVDGLFEAVKTLTGLRESEISSWIRDQLDAEEEHRNPEKLIRMWRESIQNSNLC
jgi:glycosyltransferase involved in cell wall biosynthesis